MARRTAAAPARAFELDYVGRRHPLFVAALVGLEATCGASIRCLTTLAYLGHLAAALALLQLVTRGLGLGVRTAAVAAIGFAVFPGANNLFADPIHFARPWTLAIGLAALVAVSRGRRLAYLALFALALTLYEDVIALPAIALALDTPAGRRRGAASHALAFAVAAVAAALARPPGLDLDPSAIARALARLPVDLLHPALVPRSDVVASLVLRLLPAALLGLAVAATWVTARERPRPAGRRVAVVMVVWVMAFTAPYLARATGEAWPSRYLYLPAVPVAVLAAWLASGLRRPLLVAALAWATLLGSVNTERAADVIELRHRHRFRIEHRPLIDSIAAAVGGVETTLSAPAADCRFLEREVIPRMRLPLACRPPGGA